MPDAPNTPPDRRRPTVERLIHGLALGLIYLVASSALLDAFMTQWGPHVGERFEAALNFDQERPFVYRVATPYVVGTVSGMIPQALATRILAVQDPSGRSVVELAMDRYSWTGGHAIEFLVLNGVLLTCAFLLALSWRHLLRRTLNLPELIADILPAIAVLLLPLTFVRGGYAYDLPELLLTSLCFIALMEQRFRLYYPLLALAVINKESAVLCFAWLAAQWVPNSRTQLKAVVTHGLLHAFVGGGLLVATRLYFADHAGSPTQDFLATNAKFWIGLKWMATVQDGYATGIPLPAALNLVNATLLIASGIYAWPNAPRFLKKALLGGLLATMPLFVLFGYQDEIRVFGPSFTPLLALFGIATSRYYGRLAGDAHMHTQ